MTEPREHHIEVRRTARYYVLGETESPTALWYVLHGYRQTAERFIQRFTALAGGSRGVVAPEALNRFYVSREPGRHGPASMVGGTWMTREDRENEIRDYVGYLDAVSERVGSIDVSTTVLGFSQGVATASRWVTYGHVRPERLILWGDYLPPDLDMQKASTALADAELIIVRGTEDPSLDEELRLQEEARLERAGIAHRFVSYAGGHDIDQETLTALASSSSVRAQKSPTKVIS